jgi:hypothetical protein
MALFAVGVLASHRKDLGSIPGRDMSVLGGPQFSIEMTLVKSQRTTIIN